MSSKLFQSDNPYNEFMTMVFNLIELNVLTLVTSLGVITIGASITALYTVMLKIVRNEGGSISREYFAAFKSNFKSSIPYTVILLVITALLAADFHILGSAESGFLYGCCVAVMLIAIAVFSYVFPLNAQFENTVRNTFNNAWRLALVQFPRTIVITAMKCVPFFIFLLHPEIFSRIFWIWMLIGGALVAYASTLLLVKVFDKLM